MLNKLLIAVRAYSSLFSAAISKWLDRYLHRDFRGPNVRNNRKPIGERIVRNQDVLMSAQMPAE